MATDSLPPHDPASSAKRWSGYTIDDLRYSHAVNHVKMEMVREQLMSKASKVTNFKMLDSLGGNKLLGKILSGFSMLDYGILAFQGVRQATRLYHFFKKRK